MLLSRVCFQRALFIASMVFTIGAMFQPASSYAFSLDVGGEATNASVVGNDVNLIETVGAIINVALGLLGVITVVIILIGGFKSMTAGGNEESETEARKFIFSGFAGLALVLAAYGIAKFVVSRLGEATDMSGF
jgi:hypothetical protein